MEKIEIYKFQLEQIAEALRITANILGCREGKTCADRQIRQAEQYAINALDGNIDVSVNYMTGKNEWDK